MDATTALRPAAVAGMFYPGEGAALRRAVEGFLADAPTRATGAPGSWPKALIVPHAGYVYSGATAAAAFAQLAPGRGTIRRVVLLGPVHRVPVRGLALPGATAFETPLGSVPIDTQAQREIAHLPQVMTSARAHAQEHSLEVQLPFLQQVLGEFSLLPLAVGNATPQEVAQVLEVLWGGPETVIVISSDLSHYRPYDSARAIDTATVEGMLAGRTDIDHEQACGATPVNGLLLAAPKHGLQSRLVAQCNSGDTVGDRGRVVGYASIAFDATQGGVAPDAMAKGALATDANTTQAMALNAPSRVARANGTPSPGLVPADGLPVNAGKTLLLLARAAIATALGKPHLVIARGDWLREPGATFVTLQDHGDLRGCIGSLEPHRALIDDVKANAVASALHDTRFAPVTAAELPRLTVEVSLLGTAQPMPVRDEADALRQLRPGIDGIVLRRGRQRATFLPQVWDQLRDPRDFLAQLKRKAGLSPTYWGADLQLDRYTVRKWSEKDAAP